MFKRTWVAFMALVLIFSGLPGGVARAQQATSSTWQTAEDLREILFEAQVALQAGDQAEALRQIDLGLQQFSQDLRPLLETHQPDIAEFLEDQFQLARTAVTNRDALSLALARGRIRAGLAWAGYQSSLEAVEQNRPEEAATWLLLRAYRPSTRFSRPNADATLAVEALASRQISPEEALLSLKADLLDTYQAELYTTLETIIEAAEQALPLRQAEATGLAQGYWLILQPSYAAQFGPAAQQKVDQAFQELGLDSRPESLEASVAHLQETLQSFRAAPLSEAEQAHRAGQLLRFLTLVPVEYSRGVKQGQVFLDIELQEAITFFDGAKAAFGDLHLPLQKLQPKRTGEVALLLDQIEQELDAANRRTLVIDPAALEAEVNQVLGHLEEIIPPAWQEIAQSADFDVIASVLDRMEKAVAAGQYPQAETARLEAYAIFDFGPELRLLAFAPDLVAQADGLFWHGYRQQRGLAEAIASQASPTEIKAVRADLNRVLAESQQLLGDGPPAPAAIIFNAAIIVFREGLEAVVILAALMASLVGAYTSYRKPMIWGAVLAFVATALTWVIAQQILLALGGFGEKLEAVVSLIAVGVLLLITNWFFHKIYWKDWLKNFHTQKKQILGGQASQIIGLTILGFTSIYREGFETVLFLQALVLDAGSLTVLQGVLLGLAGVGIVGLLTFKLQRKLPYKQMLVVTGILIGGVLLVMVGHTVHVIQAVTWLTITPLPRLSFPYWMGLWFGLFPTLEGIAGQFAAAIFVIGSYYLAEYRSQRKRQLRTRVQSPEVESIS